MSKVIKKTVCIFCGSRSGALHSFTSESEKLVELFAAAGFDLVYGGGKYGLMGSIASRFLSAGRSVTGICPSKFIEGEQAFLPGVEQVVVSDMFERKRRMMDSSEIFIALPGGVGTLDEIGDVYTQIKIGFVDKYCGLLNVNHFYQPFEEMLDKMVANDFLTAKQKSHLVIERDPKKLFEDSYRWWREKYLIDKIAYVSLRDGQVLMTRSKGKKKYYLPGGKREAGEGDQETLIREVQEELAVDIVPDSISYLGTFKAQADGRAFGVEVKMTCYEAAFQGKLEASSEIEEIRWMNFRQIDSVAEVDKKIFEYLRSTNRLK